MATNDINEKINALPPVEAARAWARKLVDAQGDAYTDSFYENGLYVDGETLGARVRLMRENVGTPREGGTNVALRIELATFPDDAFTEIVWDTPGRSCVDVPLQPQGRFRPRRYNEIFLHYPIELPTLVRVVEWQGIPGLGGYEVVLYRLFELDPGEARNYAEGHARRAEYQWRDVKRR